MTSDESIATVDPRDLDSLFSNSPGGGEEQTLHALLDSWCVANHCSAAALYAPGGSALLAAVGEVDFPDQAPGTTDDASRTLSLPGGGVLLHNSGRSLDEARPADHVLLGAAAAISGIKRQLRDQNLRAMSQGVELVALYEMGLAIASILDIGELTEEVLSRALMLTECSVGALYTLENDTYTLACARGAAENRISVSDLDHKALKQSGGRSDTSILPGSSDVLAVTVEADGRPIGLLAVGHATGNKEQSLTPKDRSTLSMFANQAAIAMEQARLHRAEVEKQRMSRELELAAEIQRELLPKEMPSIPGYEVLGWNRPALHVGGDYFGFRQLVDDRWALVLGDVSGKGAGAALLVSTLDSALRVLLAELGVGVDLAERLNNHVWESSAANKFITMVICELDPAARSLNYVNAGHEDGLLLRSGGGVEHLKSAGAPIGMLPKSTYQSRSVDLAPGDLLCFYSDGINECMDLDEEEYEIERLTEVLKVNRLKPLDEILEAIDRAVTDFGAGQPQGDDQTVILIRRSV